MPVREPRGRRARPSQGLWGRRSRRRHRSHDRPRRGVRTARSKRGRQDDDRRDPRGLPAPQRRPGLGARHSTPTTAAARCANGSGSFRRRRASSTTSRCARRSFSTARRTTRTRSPQTRCVELVGLEEKREARVGTLSGGQQRRLDLALGIAGDPELRLPRRADHRLRPVGTATRPGTLVQQPRASLGKTILLTTHYMDEAQNLADRVAVIAAGKIVAEGTPATLGGSRS